MKRFARSIELLLLLISFLPTLYLASFPLFDPDLGGHIAGGLWMLDQWKVPARDPFGAQGNFWVCYCWLPEVVIGLAFEIGGFAGLKILVLCALAALTTCTWLMVRTFSKSAEHVSSIARVLAEAISVALILLFVLPYSYLRPQVLSFVFLALLVLWAERGQLDAKRLVPLTILWANTHVYWLLVPLVYFLNAAVFACGIPLRTRARAAGKSAAYFTLGCVNPYGWRLYEVLWDYLIGWKGGDPSISEYAPLSWQSVEFLPFIVVVGLGVVFAREIRRRESPAQVFLAILFAIAAAGKVRYFPLFAICGLPLLSRSILPPLLSRIARWFGAGPSAPETTEGSLATALSVRDIVSTGAIFAVLSSVIVPLVPALDPMQARMFEIAQRLEESGDFAQSPRVNVLNNYSDGTWLSLAFWMNRPPGSSENRFKVSIDGRNHVTGQARVEEYTQLRQLSGPWRQVLTSWNVDVVVAPSATTLLAILHNQTDEELRSLGTWDIFFRDRFLTVLVRHPTAAAEHDPHDNGRPAPDIPAAEQTR